MPGDDNSAFSKNALAPRWFRSIYEEFEIFPLGKRERNSQSAPLALNPRTEDQVDNVASLVGVHPSNCRESATSRVQFDHHGSSPLDCRRYCYAVRHLAIVIRTTMTVELKMPALSIVLGLVQIVLASHAASLQRGCVWTASSRDEAVPALTGVVGRLARALQNFVETFPLFAAGVLIAHVGPRTVG
jgi:hypothetical protein